MVELIDGDVLHRIFTALDPRVPADSITWPVHWTRFAGSEGEAEAGGGHDVDLGGGARPGTLWMYVHPFGGVRRLVIGAIGGGGAPWRKIMDADNPAAPPIEDWREMPIGVPVALPRREPGPKDADVDAILAEGGRRLSARPPVG